MSLYSGRRLPHWLVRKTLVVFLYRSENRGHSEHSNDNRAELCLTYREGFRNMSAMSGRRSRVPEKV